MRVVDFHNHYYPPAYIEALKTSQSSVRVTYDAEGNPLVHYPGDYNILVPGHRDLEIRKRVLEEALYRFALGLPLPADESRAVVRDRQFESPHEGISRSIDGH